MMRYTQRLYDHVYSRYEEMEELNKMTDESLMFDIDILEKKYETALAENAMALSEKDAALAESVAENARLKQQVAELERKLAASK